MHRTCLAVVDSTRARLFTYDRTADGEGMHEELVERTDLVNPNKHDRSAATFGHRIEQLDADFSRVVLASFRELIDEHIPQHAFICAAPHMLGHLRAASAGIMPEGLVLEELARDLVKLPTAELRDQLSKHGALPARTPHIISHAR